MDANLEAKEMHRMSPTTEPLSRNFPDDTVFWIIAAEQEREAMRTHTSPATAPWPEPEHSVSRLGIWREHTSPADPNRFAANRLASTTSSAYRDAAGGAMRVLSAFFPPSASCRHYHRRCLRSAAPRRNQK